MFGQRAEEQKLKTFNREINSNEKYIMCDQLINLPDFLA